jgi:V8-like Glu-specific endopeptidase
MGFFSAGRKLGTCTLISEDLVMTARHVVEDKKIQDLTVGFDCIKAQNHLNFVSVQVSYIFLAK